MKQVLPISVLIPTMNRPDTLKRTLDSYCTKSSSIPAQIVVVDQSNDSSKSSVENLCKTYGCDTHIKYVYQNMPSLTQARNRLFSLADHEIIIMSDDDIDVFDSTLSIVNEIMKDQSISLIAGIDDNTAISKTNIGYILGTKSFLKRKIGHVTKSVLGRYPDEISGQINTEWAMGYFFVIRKSLMEKWKIKWDENLTSYGYPEDLDFSYTYYKHSKQENLKCILDERVHVKHLASQEYRVPSKKSTYMYICNRYYLSCKHHMGLSSKISMKWCNFWRLIERIVRKENPDEFKEALRYCRKNKDEIAKGKLDYSV